MVFNAMSTESRIVVLSSADGVTTTWPCTDRKRARNSGARRATRPAKATEVVSGSSRQVPDRGAGIRSRGETVVTATTSFTRPREVPHRMTDQAVGGGPNAIKSSNCPREGNPMRGDALRGVVFDMDGVLVESEQVWDEVRQSYVEDCGGRWTDSASTDQMGMSTPEWSEYLVQKLG